MFVFVKTTHDCGDEFDVNGCFVQPKARWEADLAKIKQAFAEGKYRGKQLYFGTNEYLEFDDFESFMKGVDVNECSELFFDEFKQLVGGPGFGTCVAIDGLLDNA